MPKKKKKKREKEIMGPAARHRLIAVDGREAKGIENGGRTFCQDFEAGPGLAGGWLWIGGALSRVWPWCYRVPLPTSVSVRVSG